MVDWQASYGTIIRDLRNRAGWSQEELTARSQISTVTISKLENGARNSRRSTMELLGRAFGLSPEELTQFAHAWEATTGSAPDSAAGPAIPPEEQDPTEETHPPISKLGLLSRLRGNRRLTAALIAGILLLAAGAVVFALYARPATVAARPCTTDPRPGGRWIAPFSSGYLITTDQYLLAAFAERTRPKDPPVAYVNFTATWSGPNGDWRILCQLKQPKANTTQYDCPFDLASAQVPNGPIEISFDVYDTKGNCRKAPNGTRIGTVAR